MCEPGTCEDCCSTDEWIAPADLTSTETARPATQTRREPEPVHAPTLTVAGFTAALRALGRDGGEPECGLHRLPEGPCEDIGQCPICRLPTWVMRPAGECFGHHASDCSLPERHESFCVGGGSGHPTGLLRGWPEFTWTSR